MALFWDLQCTNNNCDFHAVIGATHGLPIGIRIAFCSHCFLQVYVQEVWPDDPEFMADVRVMRVMVPREQPKQPSLGKTPRERRQRRKELGLPPKGRTEFELQLFTPTGTHLYYLRNGGVFPGVEQAPCPYCECSNAIVIGFATEKPVCPKCHVGTVAGEYCE